MKLSRRPVLFGLAALIAGGAGWLSFRRGLDAKGVLRAIADEYGPDVAETEGAQLFAADYAEGIAQGRLRDETGDVFYIFALSSNVLAHKEVGEPLDYIAIFAPYDTPCANMLSAGFDPTPDA